MPSLEELLMPMTSVQATQKADLDMAVQRQLMASQQQQDSLARQQAMMARQKIALEAQQAQQMQQRQQAFDSGLRDVLAAARPDPRRIAALNIEAAQLNPQSAETIREVLKTLPGGAQGYIRDSVIPLYSALARGDVDTTEKLLAAQEQEARAAGDQPEADAIAAQRTQLRSSPNLLLHQLTGALFAHDPKGAEKLIGSITDTQRAGAENLKNYALADKYSAEAEAKNAERTSVMPLEMAKLRAETGALGARAEASQALAEQRRAPKTGVSSAEAKILAPMIYEKSQTATAAAMSAMTMKDKADGIRTQLKLGEITDSGGVYGQGMAILRSTFGVQNETDLAKTLLADPVMNHILGKAQQMKGAISDKDLVFLKTPVPDLSKAPPSFIADWMDAVSRVSEKVAERDQMDAQWTSSFGASGQAKEDSTFTFDYHGDIVEVPVKKGQTFQSFYKWFTDEERAGAASTQPATADKKKNEQVAAPSPATATGGGTDGGAWPEKYQDYVPYAAAAEAKYNLPEGLLQDVLVHGERTNHGRTGTQPSGESTGAWTPFQIIPATREGIIRNEGFDPYSSPQAAADGAASLLAASLRRNGGDVEKAVREYHGGLSKNQWGEQNEAYWKRVGSAFNARQQGGGTAEPKPTLRELAARRAAGSGAAPAPQAAPQEAPRATDAQPAQQEQGMLAGAWEAARNAVTGEDRQTPQTESALNAYSSPTIRKVMDEKISKAIPGASVVGNISFIRASGQEKRQMILKENPELLNAFTEDEKGNVLFTDPQDGQKYAFKPGLEWRDVAATLPGMALAAAAAPVSGTVAGLVGGAALAGAVGEAGLQAAQKIMGGNFDAGTVAQTGLLAGAGQGVASGLKALKPLATKSGREAFMEARQAYKAQQESAKQAALKGQAPQPSEVAGMMEKTRRDAQAAAPAFRPAPETAAAAERLGVELPVGAGARNPAARAVGAFAANQPDSAMAAAEKQAMQQWQEGVAPGRSGAADAGAVEERIKEVKGNRLEALDEKVNYLYKESDRFIPKDMRLSPDSTKALLRSEIESLGAVPKGAPPQEFAKVWDKVIAASEASGKQKLSKLEKELIRATRTQSFGDGDVRVFMPPSYHGLEKIRRKIGKDLGKSYGDKHYGDSDRGMLKKYFGALTNDLEKALKKEGNFEALDMLEQAKSAAKEKALEQKKSSFLWGKQLDKSYMTRLRSAVDGLKKGDLMKFRAMTRAVPEELRKDFVLSNIRRIYTSGTGDNIKLRPFIEGMEGLRKNESAMKELGQVIGDDGVRLFDDQYRVAKVMEEFGEAKKSAGSRSNVLQAYRAQSMTRFLSGIGRLMQSVLPGRIAFRSLQTTAGAVSDTHPLNAYTDVMNALDSSRAGRRLSEQLNRTLLSDEFQGILKGADAPERSDAIMAFRKSPQFTTLMKAFGVNDTKMIERFLTQAFGQTATYRENSREQKAAEIRNKR